jgi:small redox-active disulfide protein 2
MKVIQVLGPGCPKCERLKENAEAAVRDMGIEAVVEKITDVDTMIDLGVLMTPALAVDGELKAVGAVLTPDEIKALLAH